MEPTVGQSLKRSDGTWGGLGETSAISPTLGMFSVMEDCVVSRDGTELRPAPGTRVCGKPFHGQAFAVTNVVVGGGVTTITVDVAAEADGNAFLPANPIVYVPADDEVYIGARTDVDEFTISTVASAVAISDTILVQRVAVVHDLATVHGRAAVVTETATWKSVSTELRNLATTVCSGPLSITDPPGPGIPDETDAGFVLWPSPTMVPLSIADWGHDDGQADNLRHYSIVGRMQCEALNGRLLVAVPGVGCMFEANVRRAAQWLPREATTVTYQPNPRWTRMLGIPRGHMPNAAVVDSGAGSLADGWYAFAVAYYDPFEDEVGLMSPIQAVKAAGGSSAIKVYATMPRSAAYETAGLQILLYGAGPFASSAGTPDPGELDAMTAALRPFAVSGPLRGSLDYGAVGATHSAYCVYFYVTTPIATRAAIRPKRVGVFEVPPSGSSWLRVCRGRLFHGGELPEYWEFRAFPKNKAPLSTGATEDFPTEYFLALAHEWNLNDPEFGPMAMGRIPPSFAGRVIAEVRSVSVANIGTIRSIHNAVVGTISSDLPNGALGPTTLKVDYDFGDVVSYTSGDLKWYRVLARQRNVRFTEEDRPGVEPAINELPVDAMFDTITTGAARLGDSLLCFTATQTVLFSWAAMPRSAASQVVSNTHGCVASASIVEGPFGAAWFSATGPQRWIGNGLEWIGAPIQTTWASLLRDSRGMVVCCGSAVDTERSLVVWGVRVDDTGEWESATTDALKAKVVCDTLLCWNYVTGAWSVLRRRGALEFSALRSMLLDDGTIRPVLSASSTSIADATYQPLLAFDRHCDRQAPVSSNVTAERDPGTRAVATDADATHVTVGDYAFIRSEDGKECRWFGPSGGATGTGMWCGTVDEDADAAEWHVGDVLTTPCVRMSFTTLRVSHHDDGQASMENMVAVQCDVADGVYAYLEITAIDEEGNEAGVTRRWGMRLNNGWTVASAKVSGSDLKLRFELVADGEVSIKDIRVGAVAN